MRIIPVIDILDGCVVRGVAGQRERYQPVDSRLVDGANVLDVARAIRQHFDLSHFYVADLDAILRQRVNVDALRKLVDDGFTLDVDAGLGDPALAQQLLDLGVQRVIAGLETSEGSEHIRRLLDTCGNERMVFGLDMQQGRPLTNVAEWQAVSPTDIARQGIDLGVQSMIVLDLAAVGTGAGISTLELCSELRSQHPALDIITGGGVRQRHDVEQASESNIDGLLISSALHNGSLSPADLRA